MLKKILLAVLVLVAAFFAFVATRPDTFHIERTAVVHAPSDVVYARVDDFHRWRDWSPWERLDPAMQRTFAGADKGKGAVYTWKGNDKVGSGRMTITDTEPAKEVEIRLDFLEPFASTSQAALKLAPANEGTTVTWTMDGKHNLMSKTMVAISAAEPIRTPSTDRAVRRGCIRRASTPTRTLAARTRTRLPTQPGGEYHAGNPARPAHVGAG